MKNFKLIFLCILLFFSIQYLYSQDPTWLTDITHEAGLDSALGTRILLVDVNNDNYPDLIWGTGNINKNHYHLYLNVPNPDKNSSVKRVFVDFTDSSNINANRDPNKKGRIVDIAALADVNNDGNIDIVTSIYYHRLQMYLDTLDPGDRSEVLLGDGKGHFTLVPNNGLYQYGLINSTGLAFIDYDYDGKLDLYISTWFYDYANDIKESDVFFKGNGDGSFTLIPNNGIQNVAEPMYGVNVTDWNNDGWQDIITSPYCRSGGSLFMNNKDGTFTDVAQMTGYTSQLMGGDNGQALCQWEAQPADFDNDGDMDLLQVEVHGGYDPGEGRTHISINEGPDSNYKYAWDLNRISRDAPNDSHLGDQGGQWFDLDNDMWQDLGICQMGYPQANLEGQERLYICRQDKDHHFDDISKALGLFNVKECHSIEPADYDLDGDVDLFVSRQIRDTTYVDSVIDGKTQKVPVYSTHMKIILLRNNIGNKNNWVSVKLNPPAEANRSSIGSRITVCSDGINQIAELQAGLGHFSEEIPFIKNFGLAQHNRIDSIIVRWPMKGCPQTVVYNPPINLILEIDSTGLKNIIKPWEGKKPLIAFEEPFLDFDTLNTGQTKELTFNVKNIGDTILTVTKMYVDDSDSSVYIVTNLDSSFTLAPDSTKSFTVRFSPRYRADYIGVVKFESDAHNAPVRSFDLNGYGFHTEPLISSNVEELDFPSTWIDSVSTMDFTLKNIGEIPLSINDLKIENDSSNVFTCLNSNKQFILQPGETKDISVSFTPKALTNYTAELDVKSNAYNDSSLIIKLRGTCDGPAPQIWLSTTTAFFLKTEVGLSRNKFFEIKNTGNSNLIISNIYIADDTDSSFTMPELTLPLSILPDSSYDLYIVFSPKHVQTYNEKMIMISNSITNNIDTVTLRGTGGEPASVTEYLKTANDFVMSVTSNPLYENAELNFSVLEDRMVNLKIALYDMTGAEVIELVNGKFTGGTYNSRFNTYNICSGAYFVVAFVDDGKALILPVIVMK